MAYEFTSKEQPLQLEYFKQSGLYQVSWSGRVIYGKSGKPMKQTLRGHMGYLWIGWEPVHRLVAKAFVRNARPKVKTDINHKDENPHNNCASNLEWCTKAYNNHYGNGERRLAAHQRMRELFGKPVKLEYDGMVAIFPSIRAAAKEIGCKSKELRQAIKRKGSTKGWKVVEVGTARCCA